MSSIQKLFTSFFFKHTVSVADTFRCLHINFEKQSIKFKCGNEMPFDITHVQLFILSRKCYLYHIRNLIIMTVGSSITFMFR